MAVKLKVPDVPEDLNLESIATSYRELDAVEKLAKSRKEKLRPLFLLAMTDAVGDLREPEEINFTLGPEDLDVHRGDVRAWAAHEYPTFRVERFSTADGIEYEVWLEEVLDLAKYEFEVEGFKFGRTVRMEGAEFKADEFEEWLEQDGDLEEEIWTALSGCIEPEEQRILHFKEDQAIEVMGKYPETMPIFQRFSFTGTPKVQLLPIKEAKEESEA